MATAEGTQRIANELKSAVNEAEEMMKSTGGSKIDSASEVRSRLAAAIEAAKVTCQKLEDKTVAAAKATDHVIREHPYESIGIAFGVGLLIGVLVSRNR